MIDPVRNANRLDMGDAELPTRDQDLHLAVLAALQCSRYQSLRSLRCQVRDGVVSLLGTVPSFFLKQAAQEVLLRLEPVHEVQNLVAVCSFSALAGARGQDELQSSRLSDESIPKECEVAQ